MSYSFSARGATKAEVMEKVVAELDKVVAAQPIHAADRSPAQAAVNAFIDLLPVDAEKDFSVSVSGSLGWRGGQILTDAGVSVQASLVVKERG